MDRLRRLEFPANPNSMHVFAQQLANNRRLGQYNDDGMLTSESILDVDGEMHIAFFDQNFIQNYISNAEELLIDATFEVLPHIQRAYQLLRIMARRHNHVSKCIK